jgi:hypothetical protein
MMVGYSILTDGVVGRLLAAQSRQPFRPAHFGGATKWDQGKKL